MNLFDIPKAFAEYLTFLIDFLMHPSRTIEQMKLSEHKISETVITYIIFAGLVAFIIFSSLNASDVNNVYNRFGTDTNNGDGKDMFLIRMVIGLIFFFMFYHLITTIIYKIQKLFVGNTPNENVTNVAGTSTPTEETNAPSKKGYKKFIHEYTDIYRKKRERNIKHTINAGLAWCTFVFSFNSLMLFLIIEISKQTQALTTVSTIFLVIISLLMFTVDALSIFLHLPKALAKVHGTTTKEELGLMTTFIGIPILIAWATS